MFTILMIGAALASDTHESVEEAKHINENLQQILELLEAAEEALPEPIPAEIAPIVSEEDPQDGLVSG